jgi:hypothetical protein
MTRGSCLIYRNPHLHLPADDPPEYIGVIRLSAGDLYWELLWPRLVNGEIVYELNLTPKQD